MDADRFDTLARSLITAGSRRRALTGLLGGTLGLFRMSAEVATAKNCKKIKSKKKRKKCRAKPRVFVCSDGAPCGATGSQQCCSGGCCAEGAICVRGQCLTGRGTCPAEVASCVSTIVSCQSGPNGSTTCACRRATDETARCAQDIPNAVFTECTADADCEQKYPDIVGVFCRKGCTTLGQPSPAGVICVRPCPT